MLHDSQTQLAMHYNVVILLRHEQPKIRLGRQQERLEPKETRGLFR